MKKLVGIFVMTLLIATAVLPVVGTINKVNKNLSSFMDHDIEIEWEKLYGDTEEDLFRNVKQTSDGGFIMVGVKDSQSHWLFKVDSNGEEEWSATALPNSELWPRCYIVEQTSDGGYITGGCHHDTSGIGYDRCIWKVDENGDTEWLKTYNDPPNGFHMCTQETSDGGYIVCGEINHDQVDWDVLLMKLDSEGDVEWQNIMSYGEFADNAYAVRETPDGGFILSGRKGNTRGEADFLIIKTDSEGNKEWDKTYGGSRHEQTQSNDILFTSDGGYIFLAETRSYGEGYLDCWIMRTDSQGNMIWNRTIGGNNYEFSGGIDFTDDGRIIIAASYDVGYAMSPKSEGLVIKITEDGVIEWQKTFGYENDDQLQGVCSTSDGGYIVAGNIDSTDTEGAGLYDAWLIKIKSFENNPPEKPDTPSGRKRGKPDTEYTFSTSSSDSEGDIFYYLWDWGDGNYSELLETNEATYKWAFEDNFEIRVMAIDEHGGEGEWSDPLSFSTPKNKALNIHLFERLLTRFTIFKNIF
jgi:hypothetical protein